MKRYKPAEVCGGAGHALVALLVGLLFLGVTLASEEGAAATHPDVYYRGSAASGRGRDRCQLKNFHVVHDVDWEKVRNI